MTDLTNPFPQHGSTGEAPPSGLDKSAGDQYEAEYFDFYSDSYYKQTEEVNAAITRRVEHLHKDVIVDRLGVSNGTNAREVAVDSSSGAYVNGQFTGAIDSKVITLSLNGSSSTRTDTIYVDANGNVQQKTGSTTAPSETYKLAEADINTSNVVVEVRNYGRTVGYSGAATERPPGRAGDTLVHEGGPPSSDGDSFEVHDESSWNPLMFADGRQKWIGTHDANGNDLINVGNIQDTDGNTFSDTFVNKNGDTMTGELDMNGNRIVNVFAPTNEQDVANRGWVENNFSPDGHDHENTYVNTSGDNMTGTLDMQNNALLGLDALHGGNNATLTLNYSGSDAGVAVNKNVDIQNNHLNNIDRVGLGSDSAVYRDGSKLMWSPPNTSDSFEIQTT